MLVSVVVVVIVVAVVVISRRNNEKLFFKTLCTLLFESQYKIIIYHN